ncbi:MAG: hypothetical protein VX561_10920 [Pseudomonadota bacterium]|nr:hypothetical protein [Pseudomonadota bacterium]
MAGYYRDNWVASGGSVGNNHTTGFFAGNDHGGYFVYNIPAGEPITGATLSVNAASVLNGPNTLEVHDVTTSPETVVSFAPNVAIYNDLGTGVLYGTAVATTDRQTLTVTLNADAISAINAARGKSFALGFAIATGNSGENHTIFLASVYPTPRELILSRAAPTPVPTMTEWAMVLFGMILVGSAALYIQRRSLSD